MSASTAESHRSHPTDSLYLITGLDLCTFSHQHLNDLNVATASCNQKGWNAMLQHKHTFTTTVKDQRVQPMSGWVVCYTCIGTVLHVCCSPCWVGWRHNCLRIRVNAWDQVHYRHLWHGLWLSSQRSLPRPRWVGNMTFKQDRRRSALRSKTEAVWCTKKIQTLHLHSAKCTNRKVEKKPENTEWMFWSTDHHQHSIWHSDILKNT